MGSGDMIGSLGRAIETYPQLAQMITPFLPTWAAEPEDIADAVCWLASDESKMVTAQAISVDQGSTQF
jgi:NAD(P)-dependent dehydrogenase (short-subunit alcohol dehydrogenase family)